MQEKLNRLNQTLHKQVGLYRKLLDVVRLEHESLVAADTRAVQEATYNKEVLLNSLRQVEEVRLEVVIELAAELQLKEEEVSLSNLIIAIQGEFRKEAEQLRSVHNTLKILVQRIMDQNKQNQGLVQKSLEHIQKMRRNVAGATQPHTQVYSPKGQKVQPQKNQEARLVNEEA